MKNAKNTNLYNFTHSSGKTPPEKFQNSKLYKLGRQNSQILNQHPSLSLLILHFSTHSIFSNQKPSSLLPLLPRIETEREREMEMKTVTPDAISKIMANPCPDSSSDVPDLVVQVLDLKPVGNRFMLVSLSLALPLLFCFLWFVDLASFLLKFAVLAF